MTVIFEVDEATHRVKCHGVGWMARQDRKDPTYAEIRQSFENEQFSANHWTFTAVADPAAGLELLPHATVIADPE